MDSALKEAMKLFRDLCLSHNFACCSDCPLYGQCRTSPHMWTDEDIEEAHSIYVSDKIDEHN